MNTDEKILKVLEDLQVDVTAMKGDVGKIPAIKKQLEQQGKQLDHQDTTLTQQGTLLNGIGANMGTVLEEQQAQRLDIRSLHTEVHESKEELKAEIKAARTEAKADSVDVKATVMRPLKDHEKRIDELEDAAGIPHPDKN
jgi:chromosome segregation ATPase